MVPIRWIRSPDGKLGGLAGEWCSGCVCWGQLECWVVLCLD